LPHRNVVYKGGIINSGAVFYLSGTYVKKVLPGVQSMNKRLIAKFDQIESALSGEDFLEQENRNIAQAKAKQESNQGNILTSSTAAQAELMEEEIIFWKKHDTSHSSRTISEQESTPGFKNPYVDFKLTLARIFSHVKFEFKNFDLYDVSFKDCFLHLLNFLARNEQLFSLSLQKKYSVSVSYDETDKVLSSVFSFSIEGVSESSKKDILRKVYNLKCRSRSPGFEMDVYFNRERYEISTVMGLEFSYAIKTLLNKNTNNRKRHEPEPII